MHSHLEMAARVRLLAVFVLATAFAPAWSADGGGSASSADGLTKTVLTALVGPLILACVGLVFGVIATRKKLIEERNADRVKERENIQLKILHPLLIAAEDLLGSIIDIQWRRKDPKTSGAMIGWFAEVERRRHDRNGFAFWANDDGYFAMSKLYITALYFYYAARIRREVPFLRLTQGREGELLFHLSDVRLAIGGKFGIWEAMQDSLGAYLAQGEGVKNYRQFCEMFVDESEYWWLYRLMHFYRDIHTKRDDHLSSIEDSLSRLSAFLRANLRIPALTYRLTDEAIEGMKSRGNIPPEDIKKLQPLVGREPMREVGFAALVVKCLGQDAADDRMPSVLQAARESSTEQPLPRES
jgi:hypothetical protein